MKRDMAAAASGSTTDVREFNAALDGLRVVSMLLVIAAHLFPLGPKPLKLNYAVGVVGMAIFLSLSGYLIASQLLRGVDLREFMIKRMIRVIPLSWLVILFLFWTSHASSDSLVRNLTFTANLPVQSYLPFGGHLWSIDLQMQFYALMAGLCALFSASAALHLAVLLGVASTAAKLAFGEFGSSVSWFRADEILVGCSAVLMLEAKSWKGIRAAVEWVPGWGLIAAFFFSCHPVSGAFGATRAYLAGALMFKLAVDPSCMGRWLVWSGFRQHARISYAIYLLHLALLVTWLGGGW